MSSSPADYFVDPLNGTDDTATGRGASISDPWRSVQWALDHITRKYPGGDRINVKSSANDVLADSLDLSTYGSPGYNAPLIFRGYDVAAGDGGLGCLDGGDGGFSIVTNPSYMVFRDMRLRNTGAANILSGSGNPFTCINCRFDTCTGYVQTFTTHYGTYINCEFDTSGNICLYGNMKVIGCWFSGAATQAIVLKTHGVAIGNIINVASSGYGIVGSGPTVCVIENNSFLGDGTGTAIRLNNFRHVSILNNVIVSVSTGLYLDSYGTVPLVAGNSIYDISSWLYAPSTSIVVLSDDTETLDSHPFALAGANAFDNRFNYFAPKDVGEVLRGGFPYGSNRHRGALGAGANRPVVCVLEDAPVWE